MSGETLMLWDGDCGLCRRASKWVVRNDRTRSIRAVPYQEAPSPPMTAALAKACERAVHIVTPDGRVLRAGRAVLYILERTGWRTIARILSLPPLIFVFDTGYNILSMNRPFFAHFLFRKE